MPDLRAVFSAAGYDRVTSYINSGNVIFAGPPATEEEDRIRLEQAIEKRFGMEVAVVVRSAAELEAARSANPFDAPDGDDSKLHIMFLDEAPNPTAVSRLNPNRSVPDEFAVMGREVFLRFPNGAGRSKLTIDYFERHLGTTATARNLNTVTRLIAMMES